VGELERIRKDASRLSHLFPFKALDKEDTRWHHLKEEGGATAKLVLPSSTSNSTAATGRAVDCSLPRRKATQPRSRPMAEYPRKLKLFKAWAKAMEGGATVDKPSYSLTRKSRRGTTSSTRAPLRSTHPRRMRQSKMKRRKKYG